MTATEPHRLAEWSPDYEARFAELAAHLAPVLARLNVQLEHVGSTAVPDMVGKPIIDVDVVAPDREVQAATVVALAELGYRHRGDLGIAGREAFDPPPGLPPCHPYVVVAGSPAYRDHVDLRDYLRTHPEAVRRYSERKRALESVLADDPRAYSEAKGDVVSMLLTEARAGD